MSVSPEFGEGELDKLLIVQGEDAVNSPLTGTHATGTLKQLATKIEEIRLQVPVSLELGNCFL